MIYRDFKGERISGLALGCMRLPTVDGDDRQIDEEATARLVEYAMAHGINYFDTAWGYHGGQSEIVMGKILEKYPRDSFYLASKFPGFNRELMGRVEEIFEEQIRKCRVDYFDFYLIHNVCEQNIDGYTDEQYGILPYLLEQKKKGRIRHFGFSGHGSIEVLERFLAMYGEHMEFCQLQINYLDWTFQNAREKVERMTAHGLPVWVMEPVRGGKLAKLPPEEEAVLRALRPDETPAGWAFRFLQSVPEVVTVLSGMSDMAQMEENVRTFSQEKPLTDAESEALQGVAQRLIRPATLPCTACRYCTSQCPQGLDIPRLISLYNEHNYSGGGFLAPMRMSVTPEDQRPTACIGCRSCEAVCPQQIKIADMMQRFSEQLEL